MDDKLDRYEFYKRVSVGDLVKIKYHNFDYMGNNTEELYGIVTQDTDVPQIQLFPEINVYLFKLKVIRKFTIGSIEIISHSWSGP